MNAAQHNTAPDKEAPGRPKSQHFLSGSPARSRGLAGAQWLLGLALLLAVAGTAWWLGMKQGSMGAGGAGQSASTSGGTSGRPAAVQDPSNWGIPEGEEATRRHIRDGLKAGDIDPVTGMKVLNYHDPMVPGKNFDAPAKSPFMDMMLVPRYAGAGDTDTGGISVSPRIQQNLGLRTAAVVEGTVAAEVTAVGAVTWNEREQVLLQARATGFVEKLHVRATLDRVTQGQPIAEIYVPAWVAAQEEYLALTRMKGLDLAPLVDAARQRMRLAGMSEEQIAQVVQSGVVQPRLVLLAPITGTVTELTLREGATVMSGMTLVQLQGTRTVWAEGQVPESQAALIKVGTRVTASTPAAPGQRFAGRVQALLPEVDPLTRTLKARLELANPAGRLVPGMFVQMRFDSGGRSKSLLLPSDAVIRTGQRSVVMLALDEGRFAPVEVVTGLEANGQIEIVKGLQLGQKVVLSGQFLIDSEATLRGLQARLNPADTAALATTAPATAAPTYRTDALVLGIEGDRVSLDHPEIPALKWPRMTMDFLLPAPADRPRDLAAGEKVEIEFKTPDGDVPQITSIRRVAPGAGK